MSKLYYKNEFDLPDPNKIQLFDKSVKFDDDICREDVCREDVCMEDVKKESDKFKIKNIDKKIDKDGILNLQLIKNVKEEQNTVNFYSLNITLNKEEAYTMQLKFI